MDEQTSQPIHVALVIDQLTFDRMGPVVGHLCIGLLDSISQITLVTPAAAALRLSLGPMRVVHHPARCWLSWDRQVRAVVEALGTPPPTLIHAISSRALRLGGALAAETGSPLIGHILGSEDLQPRFHGIYERMQRAVVSSQPLQELAAERQLFSHDRLALIRPGLLTESQPSCFIREELIPTILCMSAFEPGTGVDRLVEAVSTLVGEQKDLMLFLVARGPEERRLRRLVEHHKLIKNVTFSQPLTNWQQTMRAADLFVVPGDIDRVDLRLLHALAAGMAAVTGSMPNSDFVIHGHTAMVCPQPTAQSLADAMRLLLEDRPTAHNLASQALEHCKRLHSLSRMVEKTSALYREIAGVPEQGTM